MKKVAISACLLGKECRYDASHNRDDDLLNELKEFELVPFCPEDFAFGSPRPTMDLVETGSGIKAISNKTKMDLSFAIEGYAKNFFDKHKDIELFIGKDRSPSCGVCSAKLYDEDKNLISTKARGLMAKEAKERGIESYDAERY
ncbi:COG1683: Uncharacterized conserved protein / FIG143828: Hypothetical protein YbgA [hydrothermal vent metagenome]|uniref:Uncharacterized protein n=1 Tax=hydrothermal vent metagenome TaxID=652676 RepID=A0A1W1EG31_9ZZZZ